jgi:glycosyltransferase involved in cell wall biosynthesis
MNKKPIVVVSSPCDTYSGYGRRASDFIKALIKSKPEWDIRLLSQRWGNTPFGYLKDHNEEDLLSRLIPNLSEQPDGWIQITIPSEFEAIGKHFSWGLTAGIETTVCDSSWIVGINKMDLTLVSSEFSKKALVETEYDEVDDNTKKVVGKLKVNKPIEVLFEGVDINNYFKIDKFSRIKSDLLTTLDKIPESFCFLFLGHWLQGDFGEDRKNVGMMIKIFLESFKNKMNKPALILKTSTGKNSIMDRNRLMKRIDDIVKTVNSKNIPNIYVLQGDMSDSDINILYNHKKVKSMISFTKGEGYGRPLAEFAITGKPLVVSDYSGHLDFLRPQYNKFVSGALTPVHDSALVEKIVVKNSSWFSIDAQQAFQALRDMYDNYATYSKASIPQESYMINNFSFEKMQEKLVGYLKTNAVVPELKVINLPQLKKIA